MFDNAKWIWNNSQYDSDEYVDFKESFYFNGQNSVKLNISFDGIFTAYLNGKVVCFSACSDTPEFKTYDVFDITEFCKVGENLLVISVWHHGEPCLTYKPATPGVIFEVLIDGKVVSFSSENTLSAINLNYKNGYKKFITGQVGLSFKYDNSRENTLSFSNSAIMPKNINLHLRPLNHLKTLEPVPFSYTDTPNGFIAETNIETVGFLKLDFYSPVKQELLIVYGEHLDENGNVPRFIASRDFSVEFVAKKGLNQYTNTFRRIAGRYIQIFVKEKLSVNYVGIIPVIYPLSYETVPSFNKKIYNDIYDVCKRTLKNCMHEHYEDCPWREQALYALDSRNQMLCGYFAFHEFQFARFNLIMLSKGVIKGLDLLNLTYPSGRLLSIPFFSLVYPVQVAEYIEHSKDFTILDEVLPVINGIYSAFEKHIDSNGLIPALPYPTWNFYEWTDGNDNSIEIGRKKDDPYFKKYDLILNCMYIYSKKVFEEITGIKRNTNTDKIKSAIFSTFFNSERGLFINSTHNGNYSVLANSFAILAGVAGKDVADKMVAERNNLVDISLSMNDFFYRALLSVDNNYKDYILNDIETKYGYMLSKGATTFWETIIGADDFDGAGSLCHGWSALPIYWLTKLL